MSIEWTIGIVLALTFLVISILIFQPVTTPQFALSVKEHICRQSLALSEAFQYASLSTINIKPLCSTQLISFDETSIKKRAKKGETLKDAAARQTLEYMQRCKDIVYNDNRASNFLSGKSCYICYSLKTDKTTPFLTEEELHSYSLIYRTPKNERYFIELRRDDHSVLTYFGCSQLTNSKDMQCGFGNKPSSGTTPSALSLPKQYGVVYVTFDKGSITKLLSTGIGVCASQTLSAGSTWMIPFVGQLNQVVTAPVCMISLGAAGATSLYEYFQPKEDGLGTIMIADYQSLEAYGCGTSATVVS